MEMRLVPSVLEATKPSPSSIFRRFLFNNSTSPPFFVSCFSFFHYQSLLLRPYGLIFKMQILTLLFLLFDALYFVHAAMDPHYVDLTPRDEGAPVEGNASTVRKVFGVSLIPYLTSYSSFPPLLVTTSWCIPPATKLGTQFPREVSLSSFRLMSQMISSPNSGNIASPIQKTTTV